MVLFRLCFKTSMKKKWFLYKYKISTCSLVKYCSQITGKRIHLWHSPLTTILIVVISVGQRNWIFYYTQSQQCSQQSGWGTEPKHGRRSIDIVFCNGTKGNEIKLLSIQLIIVKFYFKYPNNSWAIGHPTFSFISAPYPYL